jgi:hypothetical protein
MHADMKLIHFSHHVVQKIKPTGSAERVNGLITLKEPICLMASWP